MLVDPQINRLILESRAGRPVSRKPHPLDEVFGFGLHAEAARRWFASFRVSGPTATPWC